MRTKKRPPKCVCGGSWAQHSGSDGCWCNRCLMLAEDARCFKHTPPEAVAPKAPEPFEEPPMMLPIDEDGVTIVGRKHPETSHAAAEHAALRSGTIRRAIYEAIKQTAGKGMTDDDLEGFLVRSHQSVSAARNRLVAEGWLRDSGRTRPTRYGNEATVWVVAR